MAQSSSSFPKDNLHIAMFPFMSKGHTIPLLHLIKLIHNKHRLNATFTIFTTPSNEPFISSFLSTLPLNTFTIITLPFPAATSTTLAGVESTDQLPSLDLLHSFALATEELQHGFEASLEKLQKGHTNPISFLISDGFLYWTQHSASKFNIPRFIFFGLSCYATSIYNNVIKYKLFSGVSALNDFVQVPDFPWIKITKNDFESPWNEGDYKYDPSDLKNELIFKFAKTNSMSYGMLVNSFYELEPQFVDYCNTTKCDQVKHYWSIGPFCLAEKTTFGCSEKPDWIEWLDKKTLEGKCVLYIAFGSQAEISDEQLKEIAIGLQVSGVDFLWALRIKPNQEEIMMGFEERVKHRGLIVRGWVDQKMILEHESVQGFLSHCGWNSVMESICSSVPILAWPMTADQPLNARMVVEEIKVGLRLETCDGLVKGFVKWQGLSKMVRELMVGEKGEMVRMKVKEVGEAAKKAVEEGGSSWCNLEALLKKMEGEKSTSLSK